MKPSLEMLDEPSQSNEVQLDETENLQPVKFNESRIKEFGDQEAFDYSQDAVEDNWWVRLKKWINFKYDQLKQWLFSRYDAEGLLAFFIKILPYLILLAFLGI